MSKKQSEVLIIGAGLTGLTLAYLLKQKNYSVKIIEARERIGGRIHTIYKESAAPLEMGATWLGKKHTALTNLLAELKLSVFEQELSQHAVFEPISTSPPQLVDLPYNADPSFRIKGGTASLINALVNQLEEGQIYLGHIVQAIEQQADKIIVATNQGQFTADYVISTLPPYLFHQTVSVQPSLPISLTDIAEQTHTWMGESIKVGLTYATPFWRAKGLSGTIFSNVGPIPEMYDHSNVEDKAYALKGFFNGAYFSVSKEERLALVLGQLQKYFGEKAKQFLSYEETVWRNEAFTFRPYQGHLLPHQNNGHSVYQQAFLDGKLFIAGAETASLHPGYMDGAVRSAQFVFQQLEQQV